MLHIRHLLKLQWCESVSDLSADIAIANQHNIYVIDHSLYVYHSMHTSHLCCCVRRGLNEGKVEPSVVVGRRERKCTHGTGSIRCRKDLHVMVFGYNTITR